MIQIIVLASFGVLGTMIQQLDSFAVHDPATYATEMARIAARYDPLTILGVNVGPTMVAVFQPLGLFQIFNAPWFAMLTMLLVVSIVVCTLDRTPRLWRSVHDVRVTQPAGFFDLHLNERARFPGIGGPGPTEVAAELRRHRYRLREAVGPDGARFVYGDRNQYFKLATLLTHLGLILFLLAGAVTGLFGFETVVFLGDGQTAPVQPVGTPNNLLVKNMGFEAPRRADGSFADYRTNVAVFQGGREIAHQTIRVNDPLTVEGFVFHQNTFGPAEELAIRDRSGTLVWQGPVIMEGQFQGLPQGFLTIPGSNIGLFVVLDESADGTPALTTLGVTSANGTNQPLFAGRLALGEATNADQTGGYAITWTKASAFSGMVIKRDPGQPFIWLAFLCLLSGLLLTFYLPRRRVWARFEPATPGSRPVVRLAMLADRYVDAEREFGAMLGALERSTGAAAERGAPAG